MSEVLEWKCPDCGKVIRSFYQGQFEHNKHEHTARHQREKNN